MNLNDLKEGNRARIVSIPQDNEGHLHKILAMGLFPGLSLEKVKNYPSNVIRVGYSHFSLDDSLGQSILVQPL